MAMKAGPSPPIIKKGPATLSWVTGPPAEPGGTTPPKHSDQGFSPFARLRCAVTTGTISPAKDLSAGTSPAVE